MRKSHYTEEQIAFALRQAEQATLVKVAVIAEIVAAFENTVVPSSSQLVFQMTIPVPSRLKSVLSGRLLADAHLVLYLAAACSISSPTSMRAASQSSGL
ncbi:MAG: hypothetical protein FVQ81_07835 [Candidatus Glassbacteria bacterium]|nr:hypothetical protein [Candidatus Glassbacteria bacterium]